MVTLMQAAAAAKVACRGPSAALHAAIAEAEARRAAAKKQFSQLRSVCIGAQQARTATLP